MIIIILVLHTGCIEVITPPPTGAGTSYFEAYYRNPNGVTLSFEVANKYYILFFNDSSICKNFVLDEDKQNITCNDSGVYQIVVNAVGSGENNHEYVLVIFINGVGNQISATRRKMSAGGDIVTMNSHLLVNLSSSDKITVRIKDLGKTGDGVYYKSNINIVKVGDN